MNITTKITTANYRKLVNELHALIASAAESADGVVSSMALSDNCILMAAEAAATVIAAYHEGFADCEDMES